MTPDEYIQGLFARLQADGCDPRWEDAGTPYLVGRRADFKLQWMATKLHLFTVAMVTPAIDVTAVEQATDLAMRVAADRKKGLPRGLQTGVAAFAVLISDQVEPAALEYAAHKQKVAFACFGRPTVVDTANRMVGAYRGTPMVGLLYAGYLRKKSEQYFPAP